MRRPAWVAAVLLVGAIGGTACADRPAASGSSSTSPGGVTVVRIGTEEHDDGETAAFLALFADEVARVSDGAVRIEPSYSVVGARGGGVAWDQQAIGLAAGGTFDGVVARAGAWHESGATSLDVLELPGLIDTDSQADRLVADPAAVDQLLGGLTSAGFTGLALYPEAPRYLMLLDDTTDFSLGALKGRTIRAPLSATVFETLSHLGMTPVDLTAADFTVQVPEGAVSATEGHLARVAVTTTADGESDASVAVNVPLYTKFLVLAVRSDGLSSEVLRTLRDAARASVSAYLAVRPTSQDAAADACAAGGVLVNVPDAVRTAIEDALAPVVDEFANGPDGALLAKVRAMAGPPPPMHLSCR